MNKLDNQYGLINTYTHQNYILSYLHPSRAHRALIIFYEVGLGKTYASACLTQFYLMEGYKVLYLSHSLNSINNFNNEYNKMIDDSRSKSISNNIDTMTFTKFYRNGSSKKEKLAKKEKLSKKEKEKLVKKEKEKLAKKEKEKGNHKNYEKQKLAKNYEKEKLAKKEKEKEKRPKKYGLIILDEIHNLRENAIRYSYIKKQLDNSLYSKLLLMSGTPMIDSPSELDSIIKLSGDKDTDIVFSYNNSFKDVKINYIGKKVNNEILFLSQMKGIQLKEYKKSLLKSDTVHTEARQSSISYSSFYDKLIDLEQQSSKIKLFVDNIKPNKLTVVFCFYIQRGIDFLAAVLENIGYSRWDINNVSNKTYAIIDGRSIDNDKILNIFNSIANDKGEIIHILIGSSVLSESITLYRIRELHILSPFWNYGQIEQSIGRAIRIGSHSGLENSDKNINIYLHAACENIEKLEGKDIDIWKTAYDKKERISERMKNEKDISTILEYENNFIMPEINNITIFKVGNWVWDLTNCFETNKYKISWCKVKYENIVGYDIENKMKIIGATKIGLKINVPLDDGYTIWRSCVDNKLRISYIDKIKNKFSRRGKILNNVMSNEIKNIAKDLFCEPNLNNIIDTLKKQQRYFDKQIEYDLQQT